jgi:hypothetical protein
MHKRTLEFLLERKIPYFTLRGTLEERVDTVKKVLDRYTKYQNVLEIGL